MNKDKERKVEEKMKMKERDLEVNRGWAKVKKAKGNKAYKDCRKKCNWDRECEY